MPSLLRFSCSLHPHAMAARKKTEKRIALPKAPISRADSVRVRLVQRGIQEKDVLDAVSWARKGASKG